MQYRKQPTFSLSALSLPVLLPLLLPLLLLLFLTFPHSCSGMDVQQLCSIRCRMGKGGNLCNCNAFHFAGKRADVGLLDATSAGSGTPEGREEAREGEREGDEGFPLDARSLLELALQGVKDVHPTHALNLLGTSGTLGAQRSASEERRGRGGRNGWRDLLTRGMNGSGRNGDGAVIPGVGERGDGLFDEDVLKREEENEERRGGGRRGRKAAMDKLTSLIKTALDERLIDSYEAPRNRKPGALHAYEEEADFVY